MSYAASLTVSQTVYRKVKATICRLCKPHSKPQSQTQEVSKSHLEKVNGSQHYPQSQSGSLPASMNVKHQRFFSDLDSALQLFKWVSPESFGDQFVDYLYKRAVQKMYPKGIQEQPRQTKPFMQQESQSNHQSSVKLQELEEITDMALESRNSEVKSQYMDSSAMFESRNDPSVSRNSVYGSVNGSSKHQEQQKPRRNAIPHHIVHSMNGVTVSTKEAQMHQTYRPYQKKNVNQSEASKQLEEFWTPETDERLMTYFKTLPGYTQLRDSMIKLYPSQQILLTRQRCRTRIFTLLRRALRKLNNMRLKMREFGAPEMVTMNHERNHDFLYHRDNKAIKERLLDFYRSDQVTVPEYRELVLGVNQKVHELDYKKKDGSMRGSVCEMRRSQMQGMNRAMNLKKQRRPIEDYENREIGDQHKMNLWIERKYQ